MTLAELRELRRQQGLRVATASRRARDRELLVYLELERIIEQRTAGESPARDPETGHHG